MLPLIRSNLYQCTRSCNFLHIRGLLSASYGQDNLWSERLKDPILAKISPESYFTEVSQRFNKKLKVNAVDVDIFVNVVKNESELDEVEHLLYNLRRTRRAIDTLESTHHAVCRMYLKTSNFDRLLNIINKRVDYGLFPDQFCYNMLLDHYIESKNWKNAAKVATCYMLQEDYGNKITNSLCVHGVHQFLKNPDREPWEVLPTKTEESAEGEEDDEDEIEYVRVPYVTNPYLDDHFDLKDGLKLCGKTLHYIGSTFQEPLQSNLRLIGLVFHQKWTEATEILTGHNYCKDAIDIINNYLSSLEGLDEAKLFDDFKEKLSTVKLLSDSTLDDLISNELKLVPTLENDDKLKMKTLFESWIVDRKAALRRSIDELMRDERIKEIIEKRKELKEKEKLLFFFENINKNEIKLKEAEEKISEMQSSTVVEDEYVPPMVR